MIQAKIIGRDDFLGRIEKYIEINATPEKLWPLGSFERLPEWYDFIKKVEWTTKEKDVPGAIAHGYVEIAGIKSEADIQVIEVVKNEKRSWKTISSKMKATFSVRLYPTERGTKIVFLMIYELPYSVLGKVIDKLKVSKELEKGIMHGFQKLKVAAEK